MTSFVFKIQANMDPNHRDRIAFVRVCSGELKRGMKAKLVRTGKPMSLSAPQFFFARSRITADEAYAGDVVGIPNHGTLRIGDTLTEGEEILFRGVPNFAPEILRRVRLGDAMKAKKLKEALHQMAEEGVVQLFSPEDGSPAIVGVVGALQLDVLKERLSAEYTLPVDFEMARFSVCRWIDADDPADVHRFIEAHRGDIARDLDGDPVFLAQHEFSLRTMKPSAGRTSGSRRSRIIRSATRRRSAGRHACPVWFVLPTSPDQCSRGFLSRLKEAIRQFCPFDGASQLERADEGRINAESNAFRILGLRWKSR